MKFIAQRFIDLFGCEEEVAPFAHPCCAMYKMLPALRLLFAIILLSAFGMIIGVHLRGYIGQKWIKFIPDDRSFSALFPEAPVHEVESAPLFDNSEAHLFTAHTQRGSYQIAYIDSHMELKTVEALWIADAVNRFGGTMRLGEQPGDFLISLPEGSIIYGRVLRAQQRVYRLLVSRPDRQEQDEEARLFFENFTPRN